MPRPNPNSIDDIREYFNNTSCFRLIWHHRRITIDGIISSHGQKCKRDEIKYVQLKLSQYKLG